jgi:hypothetical protein
VPPPLPGPTVQPARRRAPIARLAAAGLGVAGVLAFAVTCAAQTPNLSTEGPPAGSAPTPAPAVLDGGLACAVTYRPTSSATEVRVTISSTGGADFDTPTLVFELIHRENSVHGDAAARTHLRAKVANRLPAGESVTVRLHSEHLTGHVLDGFTLNGVPCRASAAEAEPPTSVDPNEPDITATLAPVVPGTPQPTPNTTGPVVVTTTGPATGGPPTDDHTTPTTRPAPTTGPRVTPTKKTPSHPTGTTRCPGGGPRATCSPS